MFIYNNVNNQQKYCIYCYKRRFPNSPNTGTYVGTQLYHHSRQAAWYQRTGNITRKMSTLLDWTQCSTRIASHRFTVGINGGVWIGECCRIESSRTISKFTRRTIDWHTGEWWCTMMIMINIQGVRIDWSQWLWRSVEMDGNSTTNYRWYIDE